MNDNTRTVASRLDNARKQVLRLRDIRDRRAFTEVDTADVVKHDLKVWQWQVRVLEKLDGAGDSQQELF